MRTKSQSGSERAWLAEPIEPMHAAKPAPGNQVAARSWDAPCRAWVRRFASAVSVGAGVPNRQGKHAARTGLYRPAPTRVAG